MDPSEYEIVKRARLGHEDAVKQIIDLHEQQVAATVIGILGFGPEVDDIGQETFVQFFRSLDKFRGDSQIGTYLTRIAINLSLNELKRRKRYLRFHGPEPPQNVCAYEERAGQEKASDAKEMIRRGLQKLEPKFRTVIVLRLINGYTTREIAKMLGLPQGTVLSRLARGQAKLREILKA
ncbi:MAG: RNA polymerase sigma factor [Clostridiales bacterium]|nr:RNA polymerase sigma factor [Clostridiales bacterium]